MTLSTPSWSWAYSIATRLASCWSLMLLWWPMSSAVIFYAWVPHSITLVDSSLLKLSGSSHSPCVNVITVPSFIPFLPIIAISSRPYPVAPRPIHSSAHWISLITPLSIISAFCVSAPSTLSTSDYSPYTVSARILPSCNSLTTLHTLGKAFSTHWREARCCFIGWHFVKSVIAFCSAVISSIA